MKTEPGNRLLAIDNLRIVLTCLVVLHHLSISYGAPGEYYITEPGSLSGPSRLLLTLFVALNQSYFMGLFFLLSGVFTPGSLAHKGAGPFLRDRFKRLGIPLAFFVVVISPLLRYLMARHHGEQGSIGVLLGRYLDGYRGLDVGPLWFVETLLIFSVLFVLWRVVRPAQPAPARASAGVGNLALAGFGVGLGLVTFVVRIWLPVGWSWTLLGLQLPFFPQYIAFFVVGLAAHRRGWLTALTVSQGRLWLGVALVGVLAGFPALLWLGGGVASGHQLLLGGLRWPALLFALWEQLMAVSISVFLLVWFRERFSGQGALAKRMSGAAYTVYILHSIIIVPLVMALGGIRLDLALKFVLVAPFAVSLCFVVAHLVRKLPFTRGIL